MLELVSRICSAWAVAFIFLAVTSFCVMSDEALKRNIEVEVSLFALAITSCGWLSYRSHIKGCREEGKSE